MKVIIMKNNASVSEIGGVLRKVEGLGFKPLPYRSEGRTTIGIVGAGKKEDLSCIQALPGVERIISIDEAYKLGNRKFKHEKTLVRVNGVAIGGKNFVVMAGPCTVENFAQVLSTARSVKSAGAKVLRGGAFKPRTSPYSFQGLGEEGLKILFEVKKQTGLPIVTEVTSPHLVELVCRYADILQVGARNMQNYALLKAVGEVRKPVLLKRGLMSTIEELLMAAEYILANGNTQVILCERGIRTFETSTRNTLDISAVPVIKSRSHLPIIVDPSHATGARNLIKPVSLAAVAAGADGILIEVHPSPDKALCDGAQSLSFPEFGEMMHSIRAVAEAVGRPIANEVVRSNNTGSHGFTGGQDSKISLLEVDHVQEASQAPELRTRELDTSAKEKNVPIAVIGLGQIGGSLASALKKGQVSPTILGFDKKKDLVEEALRRKLIDFAVDGLKEACEKASIVILAVPAEEIMRLISSVVTFMRPGSILMDVGSTKRMIVTEMERTGGKIHCFGGHPIAGSEISGPGSWNPRLFAGKSFVLVRTRSSTLRVEKLLSGILSQIGARVTFMDAEEHDRMLAITSHLPHLLGCALTALADKKGEETALLTAGGFHSATRVVASSPEMRTDIYLTNRDMIIRAYDEFDKEARLLLSIAADEGEKLKAVLRKLRNVQQRIKEDNGNNRPRNRIPSGDTESSGR